MKDLILKSTLSTRTRTVLYLFSFGALAAYIAALVRLFWKWPRFFQVQALKIVMLLAIVPALIAVAGLGEIFVEWMDHRFDVLPDRKRKRGLGLVALGGAAGAVVSLFAFILNLTVGSGFSRLLLGMPLAAAVCCCATLMIYKSFSRKVED